MGENTEAGHFHLHTTWDFEGNSHQGPRSPREGPWLSLKWLDSKDGVKSRGKNSWEGDLGGVTGLESGCGPRLRRGGQVLEL